MAIGHFLGGVAALIWNPADERYLLLRRSAQKDFESGAWECVSGRVDQGESYTQALRREVREEIGAEIEIEFLIGVTHFYRGPVNPHNELLGVLFGCSLLEPAAVAFGEEHSALLWATPAESAALLPPNHWLLPLIARAERLRRELPESLRQTFIQDGFDF